MAAPTKELRENSPAFRQALLKSERLRIQIVLVAIGATFAIRSLRTALVFSREDFNSWLTASLIIAVFVVYELFMLRAVNRSIQSTAALSHGGWVASIVIETSLPALALVFLSSEAIELAYKPLANPVVLLYFVFIILSTLRLAPPVCRISGIVAAVSYLLA